MANTEFKQRLPINDRTSNLLIALNEAFPKTAKFQVEKEKRAAKYAGIDNGTSSSTKDGPKGAPFSEYFSKLRGLLEGEFKAVSLEPESQTYKLTYQFQGWMSDNMRLAYDNLLKLQKWAANCDDEVGCVNRKMNQKIGSLLDFARPLAESYFTYSETGVWPLAYQNPWIKRLSHTFRYGYDIAEKAQSFTVANRVRLWPRWSADFNFQRNRFGTELRSDHYKSISAGLTYHRSSLAINTFGFGFEQAQEGDRIYQEKLDAIYLSVGFVDELATLKYEHRLDDINVNYPVETREKNKINLQFDLVKAFKLIY